MQRPTRYAVIALFCVLLHNAVMIGTDRIGISTVPATLLSFCAVAASGYLLHCRFTFRRLPDAAGFVRYCLAMVANIPLSILVVWAAHDQAGAPMALAAPLSTIVLLAWNYFGSRWAILRPGTRPLHDKDLP